MDQTPTGVREARALVPAILLLAVPGVLFAAIVVGLLLAVTLALPVGTALLFGSIVAATDPVAVTGVFKQLRVSPRLALIAEGESLVNDGMAITLYTALLGLALLGSVEPGGIVTLFGTEVLGGVTIGAIAGFAFARLTGLIDEHLVEMMLSTALAYSSYLVAQSVEASGPLACVTAGLIHGSYGRRVGRSDRTRALLDDLWEYLDFVANALVFLLVGLSVNVASLLVVAGPIVAAIVAVVLSRALVLGLAAAILLRERSPGSWREYLVLTWGGLRGALTIALTIAVPAETPGRDLLVEMAFGVVLFTMVVEGLSLPWLIRRLGLARGD